MSSRTLSPEKYPSIGECFPTNGTHVGWIDFSIFAQCQKRSGVYHLVQFNYAGCSPESFGVLPTGQELESPPVGLEATTQRLIAKKLIPIHKDLIPAEVDS